VIIAYLLNSRGEIGITIMEKTIRILSVQDSGNQISTFWGDKTYEKRMLGLETMRLHAFSIKDNGQYISSRLQRFCSITQRT